MTDRDDFDKIVEGLHLDFVFPDEPADPVADDAPESAASDVPAAQPPVEEPFYRRVEPTVMMPRRRSVLLAWAGLLGTPLTLVLATMAHIFLPRPTLAAAVLIFVASAAYLFLQLPEHGPAQKDWPDDGAVL